MEEERRLKCYMENPLNQVGIQPQAPPLLQPVLRPVIFHLAGQKQLLALHNLHTNMHKPF